MFPPPSFGDSHLRGNDVGDGNDARDAESNIGKINIYANKSKNPANPKIQKILIQTIGNAAPLRFC